MDYGKLRESLKNVVLTNTTPFTPDGKEVDLDGLRKNARHLIDNGITTFVPCGNTGEFNSLSIQEHREVTKAVTDEADGAATVFTGIGYSTKIAVEMGQAAQKAGLGQARKVASAQGQRDGLVLEDRMGPWAPMG